MEEQHDVVSIASDAAVVRLTVLGLPEAQFTLAQLFAPLARAGIGVDAIATSTHRNAEVADCSFLVSEAALPCALDIALETATELGAEGLRCERALGTVSLIGRGLHQVPALAVRAFSALEVASIGIEQVAMSQTRLTCLLDRAHVAEATRVLRHAFALESGLDVTLAGGLDDEVEVDPPCIHDDDDGHSLPVECAAPADGFPRPPYAREPAEWEVASLTRAT